MSEIYLPQDVIFNILARLPVRTLLKLRCVSKSWADLIDNPEFIKYHGDVSLTDPESQKFIFECHVMKSRTNFMFISGNLNLPPNSQNFFDPAKDLYCRKPNFDQGKKLVGSSRGLVCIRYVKDGVHLCNPWTRKYKKLPRSPLEIFPEGRNWIYTNYGFGYDDIHDDYKVVRLVGLRTKTSQRFCNEVKIYSLKSNKWKQLESFPHSMPSGATSVILNHILHWILNGENFILAIDLTTEERQLLLLPDDFKMQRSRRNPILGVSDGNLYVSVCTFVRLEIWFMKDYGINDSWTKLDVDLPLLNRCRGRFSNCEKQLILSARFHLYWRGMKMKVMEKSETIPLGNFFPNDRKPGSTL